MPDLSFQTSIDCIDSAPAILIQNKNHALGVDTEQPVRNRKKFVWETYAEYDDLTVASNFLSSEGFVIYDTKDLIIGTKIYFRCKHIPKSKKTGAINDI